MIDISTRFSPDPGVPEPTPTDILFEVERIVTTIEGEDERRLIRTIAVRFLEYKAEETLIAHAVDDFSRRTGRKLQPATVGVDLLTLVSKRDVALYLKLRAFAADVLRRFQSRAKNA